MYPAGRSSGFPLRVRGQAAAIYIFDDSFSALDFKLMQHCAKRSKRKQPRARFCGNTARLFIKNAEQIIVHEEGAVVGKGTHQELMDTVKLTRK